MFPASHSRLPLAGLVLVAAAAIFCAEKMPVDPLWPVAGLVLAAPFLLWRPCSLPILLFVATSFFTLHLFNHEVSPGKLLSIALGSGTHPVRAAGIVISEPEEKGSHRGVTRSGFKVRLDTIAIEGAPQPGGARVLVNWAGVPPSYGDRVEFSGEAQNIPGPRNPGQMDFAGYSQRLGIYSEIRVRYAADASMLSRGHGNPVMVWAGIARRWMQQKLSLDLEDAPEASGLVEGMVLGMKDQTPEETREWFRRSGTLHLFVVNGLHIGMFALIARFLIRPFGVGTRRAVFVIVPVLVFYTVVTGLNPGSIRATIMAGILLAGELFERKAFSFNTLAAAAFAILLWDTNELFMPGFQFSFGVVFAIILLAGRFQRFFSRFGKPDAFLPRVLWNPVQVAQFHGSRHLAALLALSLAAWIGSTPFTAGYFHMISPGAVAANMVVVPMAFAVLMQGILALLTGIFSNGTASLFNNANWAVAHLILNAVRLFAEIPGGCAYVEMPRLHPPVCEVTVFDFMNGGGIHLRMEHRDWLVDTGSRIEYETVLRPFLRMRGVNRLDGMIVTRGSAANIGGAVAALKEFQPAVVVDSPVRDRSATHAGLFSALEAARMGKGIYERGDLLPLSPGITARVLFPPAGLQARVLDDKAMVLQIQSRGARLLLMSGAGYLTEQWLLENEPGLKSDILIKSHHSSDLSGTPDFLEAVHPAVVICGESGFPGSAGLSEAWVRDVAARGIVLFRQDATGAVRVEVSGEGFTVRSFLGGQVFQK